MVRELTIRRGAEFTVRRQIELLMLSRILAGELPPGSRLPSIRRLAERTGAHRNTVAASYRALARDGVVMARAGSGVFVCEGSRHYAGRERSRWHGSPLALAGEYELACLLAAELRELTGRTIQPITVAALETDRSAVAGHHVLTTSDWFQAVYGLEARRQPAGVTWLCIDPLQNLDTTILGLPTPATMAVISSSRRIRELVSARLWALRGDEVAVCGLEHPCTDTAARILPIADLVLTDPAWVSAVRRRRDGTRRPTNPLPLISFPRAGIRGSGNLLPQIR